MLKKFWQEIGVQAAVSARAEEVLRENEALLSERFSVVFREEDSPAFRDWIFPTAVTAPVEDLPEATSLQRAVKRHLLASGTIGWAEGYWKG